MNTKADKILNTTIKLFIRDGIKKITMDDIAENANIAKATLYKHFMDKDTIYKEVGKHIFTTYRDKLENTLAAEYALIKKLYDCLDILSDFMGSGKFALGKELSMLNDDVAAEYETYLRTYKRSILVLIDMGIANSLIKKNLDRNMIFYYIDMGVVYFQQGPEYRNKILRDSHFQQQFMLFFISNIFTDGAKLLSAMDDATEQNKLQYYIDLAKKGTQDSIDEIMKHLNKNMTLAESKFIDFALGHIDNDDGIKIMEHFLFHGTQIQRNYCTLYFGRRGDYHIVRKAYDKGLIDAKQAFSR